MSDINIQLIVGLGNPGNEYVSTRHNAGFWFIEQLASHHHLYFKNEPKFSGSVAKLSLSGHSVWLLKPDTFMNRSGQAISKLAHFYKIEPEQILVVHDELDLLPGTIRLKQGGGHGGHNGLRDTITQMASSNFHRLRIGIGHPGSKEQVVGFVLGKTPQSEKSLIDTAINKAIELTETILKGNVQLAMNKLHAK